MRLVKVRLYETLHCSFRNLWSSSEIADLAGKLCTLPLALQATRLVTLIFGVAARTALIA